MIYFYNAYHMNHTWEGSSSSSSDEEDELIFDNEYITNNENVIVIKISQTMYKYRKLLNRVRKINVANYVKMENILKQLKLINIITRNMKKTKTLMT